MSKRELAKRALVGNEHSVPAEVGSSLPGIKKDIFYGWWIVGVAMLAQIVSNGLSVYSYGLLVIPIGTELGVSRTEMMWGKTGFLIVALVASPILGKLLDRYSARVLMAIGSVSMGLSFILLSVSKTLAEVTLSFAVLPAFAYTLIGILGTNTLVTRWFINRRGRALALTAMGASIGGLLIPYLFQSLIDTSGWRSACLWVGVISIAVTLPVILVFVRNRPSDIGQNPDGAETHASSTPPLTPAATTMQMSTLLRSVVFWRIGLGISAVFAAAAAVTINIVPFAQGHGLAASQAALLLPMIAVSAFAGKLLFSFVADRIDLKLALLCSMTLQALPIAALTQVSDLTAMLACAIIYGLASGTQVPSWAGLLAQVYGPRDYGFVMGCMLPLVTGTSALIIPLTAVLFDRTGDYVIAFMFLVVVTLLSAAIFLKPLRNEAENV